MLEFDCTNCCLCMGIKGDEAHCAIFDTWGPIVDAYDCLRYSNNSEKTRSNENDFAQERHEGYSVPRH